MIETPLPVAFLDASVLYPALLRNMLMYFAVADLYHARWSARVHDEWMSALLRNRPDIPRAQLERTRCLMEAQLDDALVEGYEHLVASVTLPDANDRHILAAAKHCEAHYIVTANLRDFPATTLARFRLVAEHPDKERIRRQGSLGADVVIVEIGGTVGDIEIVPFIESIRQFRRDAGRDNVCYVHLTLVPYLAPSGEQKTKPTQHSVTELRSRGIQPDIIVCRSDQPISGQLEAQDLAAL